MRTTLCLVLLVAAAGCASAPPTASPTTKAEPAKATASAGGVAGKDGKVCRTESVVNTRLKTRQVCLTPEEWMARSEAAQDAFRETNKSSTPPRLDGGG